MKADCSMGMRASAEDSAIYRSGFRIGGVSLRVVGASDADVALDPLLDIFRCETDCPDIDIRVEWQKSLVEASGRKLFDSGSLWRLYENDDEFQFDFATPAFGGRAYKRLFVDRAFRRATLHMNEECFLDSAILPNPLEYPLDELLVTHRLTQESAIELHSCGIVEGRVCNLFIGHSGAGKSTTARLWNSHGGVDILSDDRIILRQQSGQLYTHGTPWHGEAAFALPVSHPLTRIFVLEHGHGNVITPLTSSQAVAELFARSFVPFHRHEYVDSALAFLEELTHAVPVYRYAFEPDRRAVEKIRNFHD